MLIFAILIGLLYALPNLYGEDPAGTKSLARGEPPPMSKTLLDQVRSLLDKEKLKRNQSPLKMVRFWLVSVTLTFSSYVPVKPCYLR